MEKEQKKLLLVAVSVGVFLLVTITTAMVILTPKMQSQGNAFSSSAPFRAGNVQDNGNNSLQTNNFQETNTVVVPETTTGNDNLVVQIPKPTTAAVPDSPEKPASAAAKPTASKPAATAASPNTTASKSSGTSKTVNDYWIQTGAYSALVRAEDVKECLASNGLTSIIENRVIEGTLYYRVRLGPYTSEREANYWLALVKSIDGFGESQVRQTARQL
jgi:DedD protein